MKKLLNLGFVMLTFMSHLVTSQLSGTSTTDFDDNILSNDTESLISEPTISMSENSSSETTEAHNTSAAPAVTTEGPIHTGLTTPIPLSVPDTTDITLPSVGNEVDNDGIANVSETTTRAPDLPSETTPEEAVVTTLESVVITVTNPVTVPSTTVSPLTPEEDVNDSTPVPPEEPTTVAPTEHPTTTEQQEETVTTTQSPSEINATSAATEPPATTLTVTTTPSSPENTSSDNSNETSSVAEVTLLSSTTIAPAPSNTSGNSSAIPEVISSTEEPKNTMPSVATTIDDGKNLPSSGSEKANCFGTAEINTVLIVAIVVGVNVLSIIVTAFCVHRLVSRRLSWDPPPMHYSKQRTAGDHPLAAPRTGIHLATDTDCRAGENPATQIPIVITNEDGWCVPYSDQDKKKNADNKTEDTGV